MRLVQEPCLLRCSIFPVALSGGVLNSPSNVLNTATLNISRLRSRQYGCYDNTRKVPMTVPNPSKAKTFQSFFRLLQSCQPTIATRTAKHSNPTA